MQWGNLHPGPIPGDRLSQVLILVPLPHLPGFPTQLKEQRMLLLSGTEMFCDEFQSLGGREGEHSAKQRLLNKWGPTACIHLATGSDST